jgi:hypothetical protein
MQHRAFTRYLVYSSLIFAVAFVAIWIAAFMILYEFVYGDSYGGRWQYLAWPIAIVGASGSVVLFWLQKLSSSQTPYWMYFVLFLAFIALSAIWIIIGGHNIVN